jgi:hypothetical protein
MTSYPRCLPAAYGVLYGNLRIVSDVLIPLCF